MTPDPDPTALGDDGPCRLTVEGPIVSSNASARERGGKAAIINRSSARQWRLAAKITAANWITTHGGRRLDQHPVSIVFTVHRPTNQRADADNAQPTAKALRDGLADAGLIADDSDKQVLSTTYVRGPNAKHAVTVEIYEWTPSMLAYVNTQARIYSAAAAALNGWEGRTA